MGIAAILYSFNRGIINKLFFSYLSFNSRHANLVNIYFFLLSSWSYRLSASVLGVS